MVTAKMLASSALVPIFPQGASPIVETVSMTTRTRVSVVKTLARLALGRQIGARAAMCHISWSLQVAYKNVRLVNLATPRTGCASVVIFSAKRASTAKRTICASLVAKDFS